MTRRAFTQAAALFIAAATANPATWAQTSDPSAAPPAQSADPPIQEITVMGVREKMIHDFVNTYVAPVNSLIGGIARWRMGVCPATTGLVDPWNNRVTDRIKAVAARVGAPVDTNVPCKTNIQVIFTSKPQALMDEVRRKAQWLLGSHYRAQAKELATVRQPIQAWYATATANRDGRLTMDDIGDIGGDCTFTVSGDFNGIPGPGGIGAAGGAPFEITASSCNQVNGSRISDGFSSEFNVVTVIVDTTKLGKISTRTLADYVAMVALAQTKSFGT